MKNGIITLLKRYKEYKMTQAITVVQVREALVKAKEKMSSSSLSNFRSCCGRVYITLAEKIRKGSALYKAIESGTGMRILKQPGSKLHSVYVGYDNATGKELMLAEYLAEELRNAGVSCYTDAIED